MDYILLIVFLFPTVLGHIPVDRSNINNVSSSSLSEPGLTFSTPLPVVIWHGMGDTCCNPISVGSLVKMIQSNVPGIYVKSLQIGDNVEKDFINGYFMNTNDQISLVCQMINFDDKLANGFNLMGLSQGGQFSRALVQRCPLPVRNLITLGAQHQGVYGLPRCTSVKGNGLPKYLCNYMRKLLTTGAYFSFVQQKLVQAQYWHDPLKEDEYKAKSLFLADVNNENSPRNTTYRSNLLNLDKLVMVMFANDSIVIPKESSFFAFYQTGHTDKIIPLEESPLYTEDWLGLKELNESGRLVQFSVPGDHLHIREDWFIEKIINKYLR